MNNYTQGVDSCVSVNVHDGLFSGNPRRTPYLYLTFGGPSPAPWTTASLPLTKNSSTELRELANKAEKYWAEWEAHQQEMREPSDQAALDAYEKALNEINGARPLPMEMSA